MKARAVAESLLERFSSSSSQTPEGNALMLAWVRIGLGLILVWRSFFIARDAVYFFESSRWMGINANWMAIAAWAYLGLAILLTMGLGTRLVALVLFLTIYPFGVATGTFNLGPQIMTPMFAGIFLLHGGSVWSVDAARRRYFCRDAPLDLPGIRASQSVRLISFLCCAVLHFGAVLYHVLDAHWVGGHTVEYMMTNSYLCRFYAPFRLWEEVSPSTLHLASASAAIGQTIFQLAMIPLVFFRWGRILVIAYGAIFSLISVVFLQISMLPWVELVLWTWLFVPSAWLPTSWVQAAFHRFQPISIQPYPWITRAFVALYLVAMGVCVGNALLINFTAVHLPDSLVFYAVHRTGLTPPHVFNRPDLSMGDHWPMIYRYSDKAKVLLPLNGPEGERLRWHKSDLLYFANSLQWRRGIVGKDVEEFQKPGAYGHTLISALVRYDFRRQGLRDDTQYEIVIFGADGANGTFGDMERHQPRVLFQYSLIVNRNQVRRLDEASK